MHNDNHVNELLLDRDAAPAQQGEERVGRGPTLDIDPVDVPGQDADRRGQSLQGVARGILGIGHRSSISS